MDLFGKWIVESKRAMPDIDSSLLLMQLHLGSVPSWCHRRSRAPGSLKDVIRTFSKKLPADFANIYIAMSGVH